jgi:hypothetical protein
MKRLIAATLGWMLVCAGAFAQTFPYEDDFTAYTPGSTGAPAWSALRSLQWNPDSGSLNGPVLARYNLRPPVLFTAEITLAPVAATGTASWSAGFVFNGQDEKELRVADAASLLWTHGANGAAAQVSVRCDGVERVHTEPVSVPDGPVRFRIAVDATSGRFAAYVEDKKVCTGNAEYAGGLLAVSLEDDHVSLHKFSLRASSEAEKKDLLVTTLFNDPRDIADGGDGAILVLHRGSPAVLAVTPDGEVTRSFGRRMPTGLTDPVAMTLSPTGAVLVLNRFPGEVVEYDRNGGIRGRFGKGHLVQPVDIAALASGGVYVADAGANKILAFGARREYAGAFSCDTEQPVHLGADSAGHLIVSYRSGKTVVLQTGSKPADLSVAREGPEGVSSVIGVDRSSWACIGDRVTVWPPQNTGGYAGKAVGGIGTGGRLAKCGDTLYVLDREHARIVTVPADVQDVTPEVAFQNVSGSAALVRWVSAVPAVESRVHILRGSTWDTAIQKNAKPATRHQVPLDKLKPGTKYRYTLSPTVTTIPALNWSAEFTFETPGGNSKP